MGIEGDVVRVDLHLHSHASGTATNVWVKGLGDEVGVRESYTPPEGSYRMAKRAGMDFVTLTDHETIDGALSLLHHPDFLVGEEVSARFPEDGSYVDILLYGLEAGSHIEAQARRKSVYDLVEYLREAGIVHVLAHPVYSVFGLLDRAAVEKRLVLFGLWEFTNGSRPASQNRLAREAAGSAGALDLRQMALRHGLGVPDHTRIAGTGGSDDHGGIYGGATFTVLPRVASRKGLLEALAAGEGALGGEDGSVGKVVHTAFRLAGAAMEDGEEGRAARILRRFALPPQVLRRIRGAPTAPHENKLLRSVPILAKLDEARIRSALSSRYEDHVALALRESRLGFPALDFLGSLGGFVDGHLFISPYVAAHGYFGRENKKAFELRAELDLPIRREDQRIGVFVDGMDGIHGVSTMYRNIQSIAPDGLHLVCCGGEVRGTISLRPIATLRVPLYDGLELGVPSLLDVLDHIAAQEYDSLHVATPGPLGLAALIAGLLLGIPVVGAYHTEFGAYARALSGDAFVAEIVEVAVREFYERCSAVAVPSQATALALRNRGYRIQSFEILKNGVDGDLFSPLKRVSDPRESLGVNKTLLLYVGRVSKEKGLEKLLHGYLDLRRRRQDVHLVVVGDGPYREEMESALGKEATFTGFLRGEALARLFTYCDVFVFPSATDTLGHAVAEAQASGLPAVVYDIGGPRECIRPGETGFAIPFSDEAEFFGKVELLLDDVALRRQMGRAAREFAMTLSWNAVLEGLLAMHSALHHSRRRARVPAES